MIELTPDVIRLGHDLLTLKMYFTGIFAILFFDFFLTLGDEVEYIWKGKRTIMFYLFLMNRYLPMAFCIITLFAYNSPSWTFEALPHLDFLDYGLIFLSCDRFVIVEWLQTLFITIPAEMVLILRIFALTKKNKYVFSLLVSILLIECIIVFYAMSIKGTNNALVLPQIDIDAYRVCILYSDPHMDSAYLSTTIGFDSIVFGITILSTLQNGLRSLCGPLPRPTPSRPRGATSILETMRWDGTLYFCVILSGNVVWMALAMYARPGLKFMNAQPSMYMTSIMITRLTLSVRKAAAASDECATAIELPSAIFSHPALDRGLCTGTGTGRLDAAALDFDFEHMDAQAQGHARGREPERTKTHDTVVVSFALGDAP